MTPGAVQADIRGRQGAWLIVVAPTGLATGATLAAYLGTRAVRRLEREQVRVLKVLADAAR
jgi:hypothetical protein